MFHSDLNLETSSPNQTAVFSNIQTARPHHKHLTLFFFKVSLLIASFAKPFFHWPASVAKRFIMHPSSTLLSLHHSPCCLISSVCLSLNFADSDSCNICLCTGTLWWAISGLLFPQRFSVENISVHQCFPCCCCCFTSHICNPELPFAPCFFFLPFSPLSASFPSSLHANEWYLVAPWP